MFWVRENLMDVVVDIFSHQEIYSDGHSRYVCVRRDMYRFRFVPNTAKYSIT